MRHAQTQHCSERTYFHDDEEDEGDEDVDLWVFPGVMVANVVELLRDALTAPRPVVEQSRQRLVLRQLSANTTRL